MLTFGQWKIYYVYCAETLTVDRSWLRIVWNCRCSKWLY